MWAEGAELAADLWRQVAAVAGGELVERLRPHVASPERLGGDDVAQRREGLLDRRAEGGRVVAHLRGRAREQKRGMRFLTPTSNVTRLDLFCFVDKDIYKNFNMSQESAEP